MVFYVNSSVKKRGHPFFTLHYRRNTIRICHGIGRWRFDLQIQLVFQMHTNVRAKKRECRFFVRIVISEIPQNFKNSTFQKSAPVYVVLLKMQFYSYLTACVLVSLCSPFHYFSLHYLVEFTTMFYSCFCRFGCYFSFSGVLLPHFFKCVTGCVWSYPEYCNVVYCIALFTVL